MTSYVDRMTSIIDRRRLSMGGDRELQPRQMMFQRIGLPWSRGGRSLFPLPLNLAGWWLYLRVFLHFQPSLVIFWGFGPLPAVFLGF